jgi:exodeoxyribonuclease VII large subunit
VFEPIWTVTDLTAYIRELFELDFRLQEVRVRGEITNFTRARSGHLYFTLKDDRAQLKCAMWRNWAERLRYAPQEGDAVLATGRLSVYEAGGLYQLYAESLEPAGRGDLALAFERLKAQLAAEGLFDADRKKIIPSRPAKIGLVTSTDGAALRDILNVLQRRWPLVSVLLAPTLVQGRDAPGGIIRALKWLDGRDDVETIILARGGGSPEDLACFNDEGLARAIAACRRPVISGIGHETDFTIADFVADLRAPTPSAAAELAVPARAEVLGQVTGLALSLDEQVRDRIASARLALSALRREIVYLSPLHRLNNSRQRSDALANRLDAAITRRLDRAQHRLGLSQVRLVTVSPQATLARGYAVVRTAEGQIVRSVAQVGPGDLLAVQVVDGAFAARVGEALGSDDEPRV